MLSYTTLCLDTQRHTGQTMRQHFKAEIWALHVRKNIWRHKPAFNEQLFGLDWLRNEETLDLILPFRTRCMQCPRLSVHPDNTEVFSRRGNVVPQCFFVFFFILNRVKLSVELKPQQGPALSPTVRVRCALAGKPLSIVSPLRRWTRPPPPPSNQSAERPCAPLMWCIQIM